VTRDTSVSRISGISTVDCLRQANPGIMSCEIAEVIGVLIDGATVHERLKTYVGAKSYEPVTLCDGEIIGLECMRRVPSMQPHGRNDRAVLYAAAPASSANLPCAEVKSPRKRQADGF